MQQSFKEYMKQYTGINHRFGDLADDIAKDDSFPDSGDFSENLQYLLDCGAISACVDTFFEAWESFILREHDPTALYIAMLIAKLDTLNSAAGRIADALETLSDVEDPKNPLVSISDEIEFLTDDDDNSALAFVSAHLSDLSEKIGSVIGKDRNGNHFIHVTGSMDTFEQNN